VIITLIDYGAGNLPSVERALRRLGAETERVTTAEPLGRAAAIVLPGVGHYAAVVRALDEQGLRGAVGERIAAGVPFLGICLGLQALFESSEEAPGLAGLGILRGKVEALPRHVKLPHMGWNQVRPLRETRLFRGIPEGEFFYFAHSYAAMETSPAVAATCEHGAQFVAAVERDNLFAVQFHPEKSATAGAKVLANFLEAAR
jgi:imidazole glycerol phosphate synthase glutamine amidotransferase subunit